ncbi:FUSC family protein [Enterobacter roggenkampii]|uniref:FUSC family protein n=1 Tax=Enterobacter roggenkampii TaxID=1812935 RepID=UPI000DA14CE1|nr:FUSC family protein [Enterobacter roggenkampii]
MSEQVVLMKNITQALLPYPGRANHMLRTLVSSAIVVIVSQSLQVPLLALSLISVFFVTQTNVVITRLTGLLFFAGSTFAIALSLLILKITWDVPLLRLVAAFSAFFTCVFLMRTSQTGVVFFIIAIVVIYTQSLVDTSPSAEVVVRGVLWVWVAVNYPIAVTLVVNTLLMPAEPRKQLKRALHAQLAFILSRLDADCGIQQSADDVYQAGRDVQSLYRLMRYTHMRSHSGNVNEPYMLALVSTIAELRTCVCQLSELTKAELAGEEGLALKIALSRLDSEVEQPGAFYLDPRRSGCGGHALIAQMWGALESFAQRIQAGNTPPNESQVSQKRFLAADAFTRRLYLVFALKTTLSTALCYLFYTATDWPGIHTIMLSCLIVAQPGLGNTWRKIILRVVGAAIGSLFALLTIVFITPHLDSLTGLLCLVIPVVALASWVTTGPESISYAGIQILFTFALAVLETFGPVTELTEVRDRLVGIVLGIAVAGAVHMFISPEREGAVLLQRLSELVRSVKAWLPEPETYQGKRVDVFIRLAECRDLAARIALEPSWHSSEGVNEALHQKGIEILNLTGKLVEAADNFALEKTRQAKSGVTFFHAQQDTVSEDFTLNLEQIAGLLEGREKQTQVFHYPSISEQWPARLSLSARNFAETQRIFFERLQSVK